MKLRSRLVAVAAGAASVAALVPLAATPAAAVSAPEVVAEGLNNPYKMSFGPDGTLYVAEAGLGAPGGEGPCMESAEGGEVCLGLTGSVTAVDVEAGTQEVVADELPSLAAPDGDGSGATGPVDVAVDAEGNLYVVVGLGAPPEVRDELGEGGAFVGTILKVTPEGDTSIFADLAGFEAVENPDADQPDAAEPDSNPFAIEVNPDGGFWAVDAGGNDVLAIHDEGGITVEAVLPFAETEAPPFLGAPPGTMLPYQPVPTSITNGPAGLLVTELTGFPFPVGASDLYELGEDGTLGIIETGFSAVVDAAQGPDGSVYILEFATQGLLEAEMGDEGPTSRVTQIRPDGTRKVLLQDEIMLSNGIAVGPDGMLYVSTGSQLAGAGAVIKVDPGEARDPAAAPACDPDDVPGANFDDVGANIHREAIDCLGWWGIILGRTDATFEPGSRVRRDQVAAIVARLIGSASDLPEPDTDAFSDDDGNVHEESINQLAAAGVMLGKTGTTFDPSAPVTRGQVASILARAYAVLAGSPLAAGDDSFTDDDGTTHEAAIDAVAAAGWVNGVDADTFNPHGNATRAQLSSMVARMLGSLVTEGLATPPVPPAEP